MHAQPNVQLTIGSNPVSGKMVPRPRKDAADPDFWRQDGKVAKREPSPAFLRLAEHYVGFHQDASLTMAFARSMETRLAKVYQAQFAQYKARQLFPMSSEVDAGAMQFSYRMVERIGQAGLINTGNARDLPRVSIGGTETLQPVVTYGAAYGFNIIEESSASLAGIALESELANATREAMEAFGESMYCIGLAGTDIVGVTNAPGVRILKQLSVAAGTWQAQIAGIAAASLTNATPPAVVVAQNLAMDINFAKSQIRITTLERQKATHCLLPTNLYEFLDTTPRSPGYTTDTLLQYLASLTGLTFDSWNILQNIGTIAGSTLNLDGTGGAQKTRIVVYDKDPEVVQLMEAQPFVQVAPQLAGLEYTVNCYERSGGAMCVRPGGIVCIDGC